MFRRGLALSLVALAGCAASPALDAPRAPPILAAPPPAPVTFPSASTAPAPSPAIAPPELVEDEAAEASADAGELEIDDDLYDDADGSSIAPPAAPAITYGAQELKHRFHSDRGSLGSISVGRAHAGLLFNGVQMPRGEHWVLVDPSRAFGTKETVEALAHCIARVNEKLPGAPALPIGHLSAQHGGHLNPHVSHQSGRDVDIGYYFKAKTARQFLRANEANLDMARTWALVKTALKETTVEMVLIDTSIQRPLAAWALAHGEDPAYLDEVFQSRGKNVAAPIRHVKGHVNHIHFRFHNPMAEELGRRVAGYVVIPKPVVVANRGGGSPPGEGGGVIYLQHKARSGDTLVNLAKHYATTIEEIQKANSLKGIALKIGVVYRIPSKAPPKAASAKVASVAKKGNPRTGGARGGSAQAR